MPAAAVIPAPIAYIKVVAVKKLVVGFLDKWLLCSLLVYQSLTVTVRKLECLKQAIARIHSLEKLFRIFNKADWSLYEHMMAVKNALFRFLRQR